MNNKLSCYLRIIIPICFHMNILMMEESQIRMRHNNFVVIAGINHHLIIIRTSRACYELNSTLQTIKMVLSKPKSESNENKFCLISVLT